MPQQICPNCQANNPWENRYCGNCGTLLNRFAIVPSRSNLPAPAHNRWLALAQAPLVQAATISLGALVFQSALAWLRRKSAQRRFSDFQAALEMKPSRAIFKSEPELVSRPSGPWRMITFAWWSVSVKRIPGDIEDQSEW